MKLEFTKIGQEKHDVLNNLFDIDFLDANNLDEVDYHELSQNDQHILDMGMYINECYSDNEFNSIEEFAIEIAGSEYQDETFGIEQIKTKINSMIEKGIVIIK
jgi:hypothetical protein